MDDVTRRRMLLGTGIAIGLGAGCLSRSDSQGAVSDQYGSADDTVELLRAAQTVVGENPSGRPLISNETTTVYVDPDSGDDSAAGTETAPLQTIQQAVNRIPIYLRHQYTIDLTTVAETPVRYDEDVLVPAFIGTGQAGQEDETSQAGPFENLVIDGQVDAPESVRIGSLMFANVSGTSAGLLQHVTLTRDSPYDNESHGLSAYGTGEVKLYAIRFDGPTNGVLAYGAKMKASFIDLGDNNMRIGIHAKRHSSIMTRQIDGATTGPAINSTQNSVITIKTGNRTNGDPDYRTRIGGLIFDQETTQWIGEGIHNIVQQDGETNTEVGQIWYSDGSGDRQEGFYGQTSNGPVQLG